MANERIHRDIGYYPSQIIITGEFGSAVYRGFHPADALLRRPAAVICLENSSFELMKEIDIYKAQRTTNENIHNYRHIEIGVDKTFIAAESVEFTLYDVYEGNRCLRLNEGKRHIILKQAAEGVRYLHSLNIIHRAIKPHNFFVTIGHDNREIIKLSGFGFSKKITGESASYSAMDVSADGWIPPEMLDSETYKTLSKAVDVFSLGCVFYYILTDGRHPFGSNGTLRSANIYENNFSLDKVAKESLEFYLIQDMIRHKAEERPSISEVLKNPYFLHGEFHVLYAGNETLPGLCLIINQREFLNLPQDQKYRKGTDCDRDTLKSTFEIFGFQIRIEENLTGAELRQTIRKLSDCNLSKFRSLVVCILSHGKEGHVYGSDMVPLSINDLKNNFDGVFVNKPKIFIIQACQGVEHQQRKISSNIPPAFEQQTSTDAIEIQDPAMEVNEPGDVHDLPGMSDFLEIYATLHGFYAYRNEVDGSVFIQKLCRKLQTDGHKKDLMSLLLAVNEEMSKWFTTCQDETTGRCVEVKQMSEVRHSLTKNIQLKRC